MSQDNAHVGLADAKPTKQKTDPIDTAISLFIHRIWDIEECAKKFILLATKERLASTKRIKAALEDVIKELEADPTAKITTLRKMASSSREITRHKRSDPVEVLERSLFISIFSSFDKFIGELIIALYSLNIGLYKKIKREVSFSDALGYSSIEELRDAYLLKEIETIRRKSYLEQFSDLENRFDIVLTKFDSWPTFIEMSQRRNLFTHCDGVISDQYISACEKVGYKLEPNSTIGTKLSVGSDYLLSTCAVISEVAIMLGHTLWRKLGDHDREAADSSLNTLIYEFLYKEDWDRSISLCKFSLQIPKFFNDQVARMLIINYAIALKAKGDTKSAIKILDRKDWSAVDYRFQLAYLVISDRFEEAAMIMKRIGTDSLMSEMSYHDWPLFRDFRETTYFFDTYEAIYGYKYSSKVTEIAEENANSDLEETIAEGPAQVNLNAAPDGTSPSTQQ